MKCVILAAGHGSRLRAQSDSKPLTPVGGKPLIEHVIGAATAAGAREFTIVTGHQAERVEAFAASLAARIGVTIGCARTEDWDRPNGYSVLTGAAAVGGDYLLLMADHLFEPEIARRLLAAARPDAALTLAIDRRIDDPLLDLDDATRVETGAEGKIVRIGKGLARFDAVDTGIFLATPGLAEAIHEAIARGGAGSLSEGVQALADRRSAWTVDAGDARWLDVDDDAALARARDFISGRAGPPQG